MWSVRPATSLAILAVGLTLACGSEPTEPDTTVASIEAAPGVTTLVSLGESVQLTATARTASGAAVAAAFTWSSSDPSIVSVNASGIGISVSNGTASVTATTSGVTSNQVSVTVSQEMNAVQVTPAGPVTLTALGATEVLTASALDAGGGEIAGVTFTWASTDASIATVADGTVTAVAVGSTSITAEASAMTTTPVAVTVDQQVATVEVTPANDTLLVLGDVSIYGATATDALDNVMDQQVWAWSSSSEGVATVDEEGNTTAAGAGSTAITATTSGVSGSGQLVVDPLPVARLDMPDSVAVGGQVSVDMQLLTAGYGNVAGAFAFTLTFDPSALQYSSATSNYFATGIFDNTSGIIKMATSEPTGIAENDTVVTIVFDVVGGAGGPSELGVSMDALISAMTFTDFTADGVGQARSLIIQ